MAALVCARGLALTLALALGLLGAGNACAAPGPRLMLDPGAFVQLDGYRYDDATPYLAGQNRGVDAIAVGGRVGAPAAGTVRFAGQVAGRGVVTISARVDGRDVVVTMTGLDHVECRVGDRVGVGTAIGRATLVHVGMYDPQHRSSYLPVLVAPRAGGTGGAGTQVREPVSAGIAGTLARLIVGERVEPGGASNRGAALGRLLVQQVTTQPSVMQPTALSGGTRPTADASGAVQVADDLLDHSAVGVDQSPRWRWVPRRRAVVAASIDAPSKRSASSGALEPWPAQDVPTRASGEHAATTYVPRDVHDMTPAAIAAVRGNRLATDGRVAPGAGQPGSAAATGPARGANPGARSNAGPSRPRHGAALDARSRRSIDPDRSIGSGRSSEDDQSAIVIRDRARPRAATVVAALAAMLVAIAAVVIVVRRRRRRCFAAPRHPVHPPLPVLVPTSVRRGGLRASGARAWSRLESGTTPDTPWVPDARPPTPKQRTRA